MHSSEILQQIWTESILYDTTKWSAVPKCPSFGRQFWPVKSVRWI